MAATGDDGPSADGKTTPRIAVIGGSGFYAFREPVHVYDDNTPFGRPSGPITVARVDGVPVAFLPRHGPQHQFPAHAIPYRANMWALRRLGVRQVVAPCAVGSLLADVGPGVVAVPDQVLDRTSGRAHTYYDEGAVHVGFADPYCPTGRRTTVDVLRGTGEQFDDGGTMAVINGPRFSTRAESRALAAAGASLVNMTGMPEASLARELAMCYTQVALVTDRDAGIDPGGGVTQAEVLATFASNIERLKLLVARVVTALPADRSCPCAHALDAMTLRSPLP